MNFDKMPTVPWCYLSWKQIQEQGFLPQINQHLIELTEMHGKEKSAQYLRYLKEL